MITELLAKSPGDRPQAADTVARRLVELAEGAPGRALARVDEAGRARCHGCGEPLMPGLGLCLACGEATVTLGRGRHTVLVLGPGEVGDKLDTDLRDRLCAWIRANPGLALDAAPLAKRIPRLPFSLCARVDRGGAEAVVAALARLGLTASARQGSALREPAMRKKARTMTLRVMAIVVASGGAWASNALYVLPFALLLAAFGGVLGSVRTTTRALARPRTSLAPALTDALGRVEKVVPVLVAARHRHALRAVVLRALALAEAHPDDAGAAAELAQAIDAAMVAAGRLDALDQELGRLDIRGASDEVRARLLERDTWSARLLELTATLDALQARRVGARQALGAAGVDERLGELRIRIEALEEIAGS